MYPKLIHSEMMTNQKRDVIKNETRQTKKSDYQKTVMLKTGFNSELKEKALNYNYGSVQRATLSTVKAAQAYSHQYPGVGRVEIPTLNINLRINKGISNLVLNLGAGELKQDGVGGAIERMGISNYAIAAHNMANIGDTRSFFGPLVTSAKIGQNAYLHDYGSKSTYKYQIFKIKYIKANDWSVTADTSQTLSKPVLTMICCDYSGHKRFMVQAELIS